MARTLNRLNNLIVKNANKPGWHSDGGGLYLRVDAKGVKQWVFVFQWEGKRREFGLGGPATVKLTDAREAADAARKQVKAGINPVEARRAIPNAPLPADKPVTFGDVADMVMVTVEENFTARLKRRRPKPFTEVDAAQEKRKLHKHLNPWKLSLVKYAAPIRDRPVADVDTDDILSVLNPIWTKVPETADRTRSRFEAVLDAAAAKGLRSRDNPARWRNHLEHLMSERPTLVRGHHPAMPYADVPDFMVRLEQREALAAVALQFTILTCVRTTEALGAQWPEFHDDDTLWIVPPERMKDVDGQPREHRVPLSPRVTALVKMLRKYTGYARYLFPGEKPGRPLSEAAMMRVLERMGHEDLTVHGFRSSFSDWGGDETEFAEAIIEMCLAHTVGTKVRRAYRRKDALERRREVMNAWSDFAGAKMTGQCAAFATE